MREMFHVSSEALTQKALSLKDLFMVLKRKKGG